MWKEGGQSEYPQKESWPVWVVPTPVTLPTYTHTHRERPQKHIRTHMHTQRYRRRHKHAHAFLNPKPFLACVRALRA